MTLPKSIEADNEEFVQEVHAEWDLLISTIGAIEQFDGEKSERIETACRILWDLWDSEDKREVMGWTSFDDLFHPGNEELAHLFNLIEDRIILTSPSNQNRFYNLLLIDSDPVFAERHILRERHWTRITQFESRISRAKNLMREGLDKEDKLKKFDEILAPVEHEKEDPEPTDKDWKMKGPVGYWRGKKAIRIDGDGDNLMAVKLRSRLLPNKVSFFIRKDDCKVLGSNDDGVKEVADILLPQSDPDYQDLINWLAKSRGIK
jgi:hypothetical protein